MKSRLYQGWLNHQRFLPKPHGFGYRVFMPYICLDELPELFRSRWLWSASGRALASFRRSDFLGDPTRPLQDEVRRRIHEETGYRHSGPIYLLANLRYFGYSINPIACYYCFNEDETELEYLVAEVTNTPWNERHSYVLKGSGQERWLRQEFDKAMHVSPFNPMAMRYHWRSSTPGETLSVHLATSNNEGDKVFAATLALEARPMTGRNLNRVLWRYPMMTAKIAMAIYWQALRLFIKGIPIHSHPRSKIPGA
ncbi:DUF1365 domain-containing protein [Kineobactrum sediminis]|uniref:DUF1365 domain-containing protein n=1 Tax=Kineobactrum sediminis TaxID=1905677 RepID=A0A2N5Y787_9GAMM|nr:DUF1365 domain-containing protein [Kineobactrum sediminis]PLW84258.1 DUF1365 domain-containing protein [Kineobactrum sediminis]